MRITITLQVRSSRLTPADLLAAIGYPAERLVNKGRERVPARAVPKMNSWNSGLVVADNSDVGSVVEQCLNLYPEIAIRCTRLRKITDDIECTLYVGLTPLTSEFAIFMKPETISKLSQIGCDLSIEYFEY